MIPLLARHDIVVRGEKPSAQDVIVPLVRNLLNGTNEKVIVFRNQRGPAEGRARDLARDLALPPERSRSGNAAIASAARASGIPAARARGASARSALGVGVEQNLSNAYYWAFLASTMLSGHLREHALKLKNEAGAHITSAERERAEQDMADGIQVELS